MMAMTTNNSMSVKPRWANGRGGRVMKSTSGRGKITSEIPESGLSYLMADDPRLRLKNDVFFAEFS